MVEQVAVRLMIDDVVEKTGGDYYYRGTVCGIITKRSGEVRFVVEDDRGMLFIFNRGQLRKCE